MTDPVRITGTPETRAQTAAMVGSQKLKLFVYWQPYDLRDGDQRDALAAVYRTTFHRECPVKAPGAAPVRYLLAVDGVPYLLPEAAVPPFVLGAAAARLGEQAAREVLYEAGILP